MVCHANCNKGISCTEVEVYNDNLLATKWRCSALMNISFYPSRASNMTAHTLTVQENLL